MEKFWSDIHTKLINVDIRAVLEIFVLFLLIYLMFALLKRNNAKWLIPVLASVVVIGCIFIILQMQVFKDIFKYILLFISCAIILVFHSEIKRDIWRFNLKNQNIKYTQDVTQDEVKEAISEIVKACQTLAKNNVGGLIIVEKSAVPNHIVASGTVLNAKLSSQLIESIFNVKSPLHDGAVIVNGNKILSAGCFLPLSQEINLPKELGTRHRAALGMSETNDVFVIVVSEETGVISFAENGKLTRYINSEMLTSKLQSVFGLDDERTIKKQIRRRK